MTIVFFFFNSAINNQPHTYPSEEPRSKEKVAVRMTANKSSLSFSQNICLETVEKTPSLKSIYTFFPLFITECVKGGVQNVNFLAPLNTVCSLDHSSSTVPVLYPFLC